MMTPLTVIASCFAAVCLLQMAPAAVAAGAVALSADSLRTDSDAGGSETAQMKARAHLAANNVAVGGSSHLMDGGRYRIKLVSVVMEYPSRWDEPMYLAVDRSLPLDMRDSESSYVFAEVSKDGGSVFVAQFDAHNNAYKFMNEEDGWFLGVHDTYPMDRYNGHDRLIVHSDPAKAVLWQLMFWDYEAYLCEVYKNLDHTGSGTQWLKFGMPLDRMRRNSNSDYVVVLNDFHQEAVVEFELL